MDSKMIDEEDFDTYLDDDMDRPDIYCQHWDLLEDCERVCVCGHLCSQHGEDFCTKFSCDCLEFEEE